MTPAARTQAAIELLDQIVDAAEQGGAAADTLVSRYFATRRYAGSKDRRAVRELVYAAIRLAGERPADGRSALGALADRDAAVAATFDGSAHGPSPLTADEPRAVAGAAPAWLVAELAASGIAGAALDAQVDRAPLDLRVNRLRSDVAAVRHALPDAEPVRCVEHALRLPTGTSVEASPPWQGGAIEVQDAGSQLVTTVLQAAPGQTIVDLCAGAGGKTLALAAAMANEGRIVACDIQRARLSRLRPRAERAGVTIAGARLLDPGKEPAMLADLAGQADGVLVDAPCSGTGTWRRNPEARWRLTPGRIAAVIETQAQLLGIAAALVKPGGVLVYIVCSLLDAEGPGQIGRFLAGHPGWRAEDVALPLGLARGDGWRLEPQRDATDGFFVARLRAPC